MGQQNSEQSVNFYLSLATLPILGVFVTAAALQEVIMSIGLTSEEIFRGDRLPLLTKPK